MSTARRLSTSVHSSHVEARRAWARSLIRRGSGAPAYGSAEWLGLPEGDPRKVAAVVRAAECWALDGDHLAENLAAEVETLRRSHKAAEDADYQARAAAHREQWRHLRVVPTVSGETPGTTVPPGTPPRDLHDVGRDYMTGLRGGRG